MKKLLFIAFVFVQTNIASAQNLISNPSFEEFIGNCSSFSSNMLLINDNLDSIGAGFKNSCVIKDWMSMSETPDAFSLHSSIVSLPKNDIYCKHVYPHTDSTIVGGVQFFSNSVGHGFPYPTDYREIIENKLTTSLIKDHEYRLSYYTQLIDTVASSNGGQIGAINSFSAYFSDTVINWQYNTPFPVGKYQPQIQINQMVTDTGNWVLLTDTFIAKGGERYVCIGNFKSDSLTGWQLVDSIRDSHLLSYYFFDDVSLIDITPNGVEEFGIGKLEIYPNPASQSLVISSKSLVNTIEVSNVLGQVCIIPPLQRGQGGLLILNIASLPSGIYFLKATDTNGNVMNGKFVKE